MITEIERERATKKSRHSKEGENNNNNDKKDDEIKQPWTNMAIKKLGIVLLLLLVAFKSHKHKRSNKAGRSGG